MNEGGTTSVIMSDHPFSPLRLALPPDGRQSERALAIRRGVCRRMRAERLAVIPEVTLNSGRRADLVALSAAGLITIVEIKSSIGSLPTSG